MVVGRFVASRTTKSGSPPSAGSSPLRNSAKLQPSGARVHPTTATLRQPFPSSARTRRERSAVRTKNEATNNVPTVTAQRPARPLATAIVAATAPLTSDELAASHERDSAARSLLLAEGGAGTRDPHESSDTRSG